MEPGEVVWLPGSGYAGEDENAACAQQYGNNYYACGDAPLYDGTLVYCCPS